MGEQSVQMMGLQRTLCSLLLVSSGEVILFQGTGLAAASELFTGAQWPSAVYSGHGLDDYLHIQVGSCCFATQSDCISSRMISLGWFI